MAGHDAVAGLHPTIPPRALPYSKTSDLEFFKPRPAALPRSITTVLPPLHAQHPPQPSSRAAYYDPGEVNRKVAAMLAATEALKPNSPAQSSRKQAMKNKVLSKVAGLFGRRRSNKSGKDNEKRVNNAKPEGNPYLTNPQQPFSTGPLHLPGENTETRTWIPHDPIEHRIPRKPLPSDRSHFQTPRVEIGGPLSIPEAMGEENMGIYGIEKEAEVGNSIEERGEDCGGSQTRIGDPFGSEQSFDNLEGFLTTQPVGSSTPKKRGSYSGDWTVVENNNDRFPPPGRLSHLSANDADDELTDEDSQSGVSEKKQGKRPAKPTRLQRSSTNVLLDVGIIEPQRVKKHPAPSKASLEELSRQFDALLPRPNNQGERAMNGVGLSSIMATFPRPPARIPASQTSILSTAEYHAFMRANPQASSAPLTPADQPLSTAAPPARAPPRRAWQTGEGRHVPRRLTSGGPGVQIPQSRTSNMDELRRDYGTYRHEFRGAQGRPV